MLLVSLMASLASLSCTNNRNPRLNLSTVCDTTEDIASFELLDSEADDLELVTGGLPAGSTFETTGFVLTVIDNGITTSFVPLASELFTDEPEFGVVCTQGFQLDQPASGSYSFTVPVLSDGQEMFNYTFDVDYDSERNNDDPVFNTDDPVMITPLAGSDIITALLNLGYEVNLYTPNDGNNREVNYTANARILASNITLRLQIRLVE